MLRHSCGFALANMGIDTRLIQDYLGHRNIRHTVSVYRQQRGTFLWHLGQYARQTAIVFDPITLTPRMALSRNLLANYNIYYH